MRKKRNTIGQQLLIKAGFRNSAVSDYDCKELGVVEEWRKEIEGVGCVIKYYSDGKFHEYSIEKYGDIIPMCTNALTCFAVVKRHSELFKLKDMVKDQEGENQ